MDETYIFDFRRYKEQNGEKIIKKEINNKRQREQHTNIFFPSLSLFFILPSWAACVYNTMEKEDEEEGNPRHFPRLRQRTRTTYGELGELLRQNTLFKT